jgi:hypothetical protein
MAKYKLLSQHYSEEDKLLEPETEVGDGTKHLWTRKPTVEMEGLDEEGRLLIDIERERTGNRIAPLDDLPMTMQEAAVDYDKQVEARVASQAAAERTTATLAERRAAVTLADRARR